jgi:lipoprotein-releasing system ATP-binding protein
MSDMTTGQNVIEARGLGKTYNDGVSALTIFENIEFHLKAGETVGIIGSSGAGKTTLLNILGGLDAPSSGDVRLCGVDLGSANDRQITALRNQHLGFVYQFHHLLAEFSAQENAAMPLIIAGVKKKRALEQSAALLERVGLASRLAHKPSELSGGERQRVAIARALVNNPRVVMMDEPTGNLDEQTARSIQELMLSLRTDSGTSFVVVTHDTALAAKMDRALHLEQGGLIAV